MNVHLIICLLQKLLEECYVDVELMDGKLGQK